ncbi:HAMP domain-containing sensor histidine kinase [Paraflavisolibacter sp. H34]|uniref:sensor histidine kinase n=1 Tax=Huijunlia imazamoxiresistens TaxID=3127457 RepID=UPI003017F235
MRQLKNIKWLPVLMGIAILVITLFQLYWLRETYEREKKTLEMRSRFTFRETVYRLQAAKLKLEKMPGDSAFWAGQPGHRGDRQHGGGAHNLPRQRMIGLMNVLREKMKDSAASAQILGEYEKGRSGKEPDKFSHNNLIRLFRDVDSLQDSVHVTDIERAFNARMQQQNMKVPFTIVKSKADSVDEPFSGGVTIGFSNPVVYKYQLGETRPYLINRIKEPILLSVFIVGFTIFSFVLLYKSLLKQQRLAQIKNEFISNITHELKTPIATVSVAIEAMRSFSASMDPQRTREYLDISANELLRLSLLVDKVLKLSMFEKKEVDLKYERLEMKELIEEVTSSMRLQFEKHGADVEAHYEGDTTLEGDRLHLVSVIFNLLDNALKYSNANPHIKIRAKGNQGKVTLNVTDNGIGIPEEYREKIFEKFFRVPTGNLHNAKGYGLGLSYVAHVVDKHKGTIKVESTERQGSKFVISLPKYTA